MKYSINDKVIAALQQAEQHNSSLMVRPEVILWPDPERQWESVIPALRKRLPHLLAFGSYVPENKQGPAIWLKCMVARVLPEADWDSAAVPIIYLPGVSRIDLRNVGHAELGFQPLIEYQYTGSLFLQENGKEWTIQAFIENSGMGLGIRVASDKATKYALKQALPAIFEDPEVFYGKTSVNADFLNSQLFPDVLPSILKWLCKGDTFLKTLEASKKEAFVNLCVSQYDFEPDYKNVRAIAEKLGSQKNSWKQVWQLYANAPHKYPEIENLLRSAKPDDLGTGMFALPRESWPQVNEQEEESLYEGLTKASKQEKQKALSTLKELEKIHVLRRNWVWHELEKTPLADSLQFLLPMAAKACEPFASGSINELKDYYTSEGFTVDRNMRKALAAIKSVKDSTRVISLIQLFYRPWLESLATRFQKLVEAGPDIFTKQNFPEESEEVVVFVDALRYELAEEVSRLLVDQQYTVKLDAGWTAIPSLTPTAKPAVAPLASQVSQSSEISEFKPQTLNGKKLDSGAFKELLSTLGYTVASHADDMEPGKKYWIEVGKIDSQGHEEQSAMVRRIEELYEIVRETLEVAFIKGFKRIKVVTDHGWLLLPGGLPKTLLNAGLTETRWGRCALIKEGAPTGLLHLPWQWNPSVFIAYAPGISFFKANQEYAHGGISLQECLVPAMVIENPHAKISLAKISEVKWVNLKCTVLTTEAGDNAMVDIRTKYTDENTSVVESKNRSVENNKGVLMVSDEAEGKAAFVVLTDDSGKILDKKLTTIGG